MNCTQAQIAGYVAEYEASLLQHKLIEARDWRKIEQLLVNEHEWTEKGAACLVQLVRQYGSFILGNAYALALVLEIEDGELGL